MRRPLIGRILMSIALLALGMPQSAAPFSVYAQTPQGSALTVDALDNATYRPRAADIFGDTVQLVAGQYENVDAAGNDEGGIGQGSYVFGDLNGDGVDDAVAIVTENTGCCASSAQAILAAYVNESGAPIFAGSVGFGAGSAVNSLTVQSGIITLTGLQVGGNDAFCCPSQPFSDQFTLGDAGLVAVSPSAAQPAIPAPTAVVAPGIPASTVDISLVRSAIPGPGGQAGFAGQVLMPPPGLQPFASFQLFSAVPVLGRDTLWSGTSQLYPQSYALSFAHAFELSHRQFGVARATIAGASSRQMYDETAADSLKTFTGCAPTAAYCGRPTFPPCGGMGCTVHAELFRGLTVKGANALALHWWDDHGVGWDVTWFDSQAGVSYRLTTENGADPGDFDTGVSASNQAGAQQLAAVAEKLVPWTGT